MRVAAIDDIHGDLPALEAVLQEIRGAGVEQSGHRAGPAQMNSTRFSISRGSSTSRMSLRLSMISPIVRVCWRQKAIPACGWPAA